MRQVSKQRMFAPPKAVRNAAARGLKLRQEYERGEQGIGSGVTHATNLSNGDEISLTTIKRMNAFFSRHQRSHRPNEREDDGGPTAGTIAWLLWGGNPGQRWVRRILRQEGVTKAMHNGVVKLPGVTDLQLGPSMYGVVVADGGTDFLVDLNTPGTVIKCGQGELVLFNMDEYVPESTTPMAKALDIDTARTQLVEDQSANVRRLCKAASGTFSGYDVDIVDDTEDAICEYFDVADLGVEILSDLMYFTQQEQEEHAQICKIDEELGLVFGWAVICTQDGEPFIDSQNDHAPEDATLIAATDFMLKYRTAGEMHRLEDDNEPYDAGDVVFCFPLTTEIAKAFNIQTDTTGLLIAMKPRSEDMLEKFRDGTYTGFSIGGKYLERVTEVLDA